MKTLLLIRGLPGSGKSTLASYLQSFEHFENDQYFVKDGIYQYDSGMAADAAQACLERVREAMGRGVNIVVSNVFSTYWQYKYYYRAAEEHGYRVQRVLCQDEFGSVHGVSPDEAEGMKRRFVI